MSRQPAVSSSHVLVVVTRRRPDGEAMLGGRVGPVSMEPLDANMRCAATSLADAPIGQSTLEIDDTSAVSVVKIIALNYPKLFSEIAGNGFSVLGECRNRP